MQKIIRKEFIECGKTKPIWVMRQAGRYLKEYMEIRNKFSNFIEFCMNPEACSKATLIPIEKFDFDSAIIFSDILTIPHALGQKVEFKENEGPVLGNINLNDLKIVDFKEKLSNVYDAIKITRASLNDSKSLIGFSGCPFTLSCYMLNHKKSKDYTNVINYIYSNRNEYNKLIDLLTESVILHVSYQIESGCDIIQLFESWGSVASVDIFNEYVIEPNKKIVAKIKQKYPDVPIICFPRGAGTKYKDFATEVSPDGISIDQFTPMSWACENINKNILLQGNLDPVLLSSDVSELDFKKYINNILETTKGRKFIFNLGHGIMPDAKVDKLYQMIKTIREFEL